MDPYAEDPRPLDRGDTGLALQASALASAAKQRVQDWAALASDAAREATIPGLERASRKGAARESPRRLAR
jgi:hypothetical protein